MEKFNLEEWLKNKSRKVVTRHGKPVRIVCWDRKHDFPIIALEDCGNKEFVNFVTSDGRIDLSGLEDNHDLFFADEEKCNKILNELKSYLKSTPKEQIEKDWQEIQDWYSQNFAIEKHKEEEEMTVFEKRFIDLIKFWMSGNTNPEENLIQSRFDAKELLDLARKEIEKENSEFKPKFTYNEKDYSVLANKLIEFRNNTPLISVSYRDGSGRNVILHYEKEILDLARKELEANYYTKVLDDRMVFKSELHATDLQTAYNMGKQDALKDLPKWEKEHNAQNGIDAEGIVHFNGWSINLKELFKILSKEE